MLSFRRTLRAKIADWRGKGHENESGKPAIHMFLDIRLARMPVAKSPYLIGVRIEDVMVLPSSPRSKFSRLTVDQKLQKIAVLVIKRVTLREQTQANNLDIAELRRSVRSALAGRATARLRRMSPKGEKARELLAAVLENHGKFPRGAITKIEGETGCSYRHCHRIAMTLKHDI
jgi:hypothetical protein